MRGIEPRLEFDCLSTGSSDEVKAWNAGLWSRYEQAEGNRLLAAFLLDTDREDDTEHMVLAMFRIGRKRLTDGSKRWIVVILVPNPV